MLDGYYTLNLEFNKALPALQDVKTSDHKSRGLDITVVSNGAVQDCTGKILWCSVKTPDGRTVTQQAEQEDATTGHYILTYPDSMINVAGSVSIELTLIDGTSTLSTNTGTINVVQAVTSYQDMQDDPNYPALLKAMDVITTMQSQIAAMQTTIADMERIPTGMIVMSPTTLNSTYWIPLQGQSTSSYPTLSPIFGANLPNMAGKVAVGIDSTQTEFNTLGKSGGEKTHHLSIAEMPSHDHGLKMYKTADEGVGHFGALPQGYAGYGAFADRVIVTGPDAWTSNYMENTGGDQAHSNLQPYTVLGNYYVHL